MSNLLQRILTAAVLLAVFISALCVSTPWPLLLLTLLLIAAAGWEWSRLVGWPGWRAWASGALCAGLCGALCLTMATGWPVDMVDAGAALSVIALWLAAGLLWIVGGAWLLWRGVERWPRLPRWLRWSVGVAMLVVAWFALAWARISGVNFLLSVLALTWAADIGAYCCGRALGGKLTGGRKLAPAISPGKSWEGVAGGFACVLLVGAIWIWVDRSYAVGTNSLYTILWRRGAVWFVLGLAFLTAMSVVGDLTESLVKRAAGVKDSSALLPGHGGVLDRIDALLPTLLLAMLLVFAAL